MIVGEDEFDDDGVSDIDTIDDVFEAEDMEISRSSSMRWWRKYTDFQTLVIALLMILNMLVLFTIFLIIGIYVFYYYGEPELEIRIKREIRDEIGEFAAFYIQSAECMWESACPALFSQLIGDAGAESTCNGLGTTDLLYTCGLLDPDLLTPLSYSPTWTSPFSGSV